MLRIISSRKATRQESKAYGEGKTFDFVFVDAESFRKFKPSSFEKLVGSFREYKG